MSVSSETDNCREDEYEYSDIQMTFQSGSQVCLSRYS